MKITFCILLLLIAASAEAQQTIDLDTAVMAWTYQGSGHTGFKSKCGPTAGNYTNIVNITDPAARTTSVKGAISGSGVWYCVVVATNSYGDTPASNEINFSAGARPSLSPQNLTVKDAAGIVRVAPSAKAPAAAKKSK